MSIKIKKISTVIVCFIMLSMMSINAYARRVSNTLEGSFNVADPSPDKIYVSQTGNDSNNGLTETTAVASINTAIRKVKTGGTVQVLSGTYAQNVMIDKSVNLIGSSESEARGTGSSAPKLQGSPTAAASAIIINSNVSNVSIIGFEISDYGKSISTQDSTPTNLCGIVTSGSGTSNIIIKNNYIHDIGRNAVLATGNSSDVHNSWTVKNNVFRNCGDYNVEVLNPNDLEISNNEIYGGYTNIKLVEGSDISAQNIIITGNDLTRTKNTTTFAQIFLQTSSNNLVNVLNISKNNITNSVGNGKVLMFSGSGLSNQSAGFYINDNSITSVASSIDKMLDVKGFNVDATKNLWNGNANGVDNSTASNINVFPFAVNNERNTDGTFKNLKQPVELTWDDGTTVSKTFESDRGTSKVVKVKSKLSSNTPAQSNIDIVFEFTRNGAAASDVSITADGFQQVGDKPGTFKKHYTLFTLDDVTADITFGSSTADGNKYILDVYAEYAD